MPADRRPGLRLGAIALILLLQACLPDATDSSPGALRRSLPTVVPAWYPSARNMPSSLASASAGALDFERHCRACHGEDGLGQAGLGAVLDPPPPDFHDPLAMFEARPIWYYRALTVGTPGTAMQPWDHVLSEEALWDAVFFLWSRSDPAAELALGRRLYAERCAECHGPDGAALNERRFDDPSRVAGSRSDDARGLAVAHPLLDGALDAAQREAVLAYLWTFLYEPEPLSRDEPGPQPLLETGPAP